MHCTPTPSIAPTARNVLAWSEQHHGKLCVIIHEMSVIKWKKKTKIIMMEMCRHALSRTGTQRTHTHSADPSPKRYSPVIHSSRTSTFDYAIALSGYVQFWIDSDKGCLLESVMCILQRKNTPCMTRSSHVFFSGWSMNVKAECAHLHVPQ